MNPSFMTLPTTQNLTPQFFPYIQLRSVKFFLVAPSFLNFTFLTSYYQLLIFEYDILQIQVINTDFLCVLSQEFFGMERFIFDTRVDPNDRPKYLKRNQQPNSNSSEIHKKNDNNFLKRKVFLTFQCSYIGNILPKTFLTQKQNRINNLDLVLEKDDERRKLKTQPNAPHDKRKWKSTFQSFKEEYQKQLNHDPSKIKKKKVKTQKQTSPGVGSYDVQNKKIRKRIVYDVKIRGKPQAASRNKMASVQSLGKQVKRRREESLCQEIKCLNRMLKDAKKGRKIQEQYERFIHEIDGSNVWNKLIKKYKLNVSKFDTFIE